MLRIELYISSTVTRQVPASRICKTPTFNSIVEVQEQMDEKLHIIRKELYK